jgi:hypothetical protein
MNVRVAIAVAIAVLAVFAGASDNLQVLFGETVSKLIVAGCSLTVASLAAALGVLTTQSGQVANVADIPGVSKVLVNDQASPAIARLAMDPANSNVAPEPGHERAVAEIAKAA